MFAIFLLFSVFINNDSLYEAFGFVKVHPILVGLILFNDLLQPIDTFLKLGMNILSRKFEFEAGKSSANPPPFLTETVG